MSYTDLRTLSLDFAVNRQVNSVFPPRKAVMDLMIVCIDVHVPMLLDVSKV